MKKHSFAFIFHLLLLSLTAQGFGPDPNAENSEGEAGLTDEEMRQSREFIHQGMADDVNAQFRQMCQDPENMHLCNAELGNSINDPVLTAMAPMVEQAYGYLNARDNKITFHSYKDERNQEYRDAMAEREALAGNDSASEEALNQAEQREKNAKSARRKDTEDTSIPDVCAMLPVAAETIAQVRQQIAEIRAQTNFNQNADDRGPQYVQREALVALKESHRSKRDQARQNSANWSLGGSCYSTMLSQQIMSSGPTKLASSGSVALKGSSAVFLASYWKRVERQHHNAMRLIDQFIARLPKVGECNPHTQRGCYCSNRASLHDPQYAKFCLPEEFAKIFDPKLNPNPQPCLDENEKTDYECLCAKRDICYNDRILSQGHQLGLKNSFLDGLKKNSDLSFRGKYNGAKFDESYRENMAYAKRTLKDQEDSLFGDSSPPPLTAEQKKAVDAAIKAGVPAKMAANMFSPTRGGGMGMGNLGGGELLDGGKKPKNTAANRRRGEASIKTVHYGDAKANFDQKGAKKGGSKSGNILSKLLNKNKKGKTQKSGTTVLTFTDRAQQRAPQVRKNPGVPIWNIISHRYRTSAWNRFDVIEEQEPKKNESKTTK